MNSFAWCGCIARGANLNGTWHVQDCRKLVIGQPASGKDNVVDLLRKFIAELQDAARAVLSPETVLSQGLVTMSAVVKLLDKHRAVLVFVNSELDQPSTGAFSF